LDHELISARFSWVVIGALFQRNCFLARNASKRDTARPEKCPEIFSAAYLHWEIFLGCFIKKYGQPRTAKPLVGCYRMN